MRRGNWFEADIYIPSFSPDGDRVTAIAKEGFRQHFQMTRISIPPTVTSIGECAFLDSPEISEVHITDLAAWCAIRFADYDSNPLAYAHKLYLNGELVTEITFPEGTESIGDYLFVGCNSITKVTIPSSVKSIGVYAFSACGALTDIYFGGTNTEWDAIEKTDANIPETALVHVAPCEHAWVDATCEAPKTCSVCGATEGEALGHTEKEISAVDATCTEVGWTAGTKCSVCGEILVAPDEIPALGHSEEILAAREATCVFVGQTEGKRCTTCGEITVPQEVIPAKGHTEEIIPAIPKTCTEDGATAGTRCSVCDKVIKAPEVLQAIGHSTITYASKEPTCTEKGWSTYIKCTHCDYTTYSEKPALGHTWVDATCEAPKTCSVCGATEGEALGHTYGAWVTTKQPTDDDEGSKQKVCVGCGDTVVEAIPPKFVGGDIIIVG